MSGPTVRLVAIAALLAAPAAADAAALETTLVSRVGLEGPPAGARSLDPSLSSDGRLVAFVSDAANLSAADRDGTADVFVKDLLTGVVRLVSRASGAGGAAADDSSFDPALSADGRRVAFASDADNLSDEADPTVTNVFLRDLVTGTTTLVSRASGPGRAPGDRDSFAPSLSGDGRLVAFASSARTFDPAAPAGVPQVYVHDVVAGTTTLASRAAGLGGAVADRAAVAPAVAADGGAVAFASSATNLSGAAGRGVWSVYVRTLATGATTLVSRATGAEGPAAAGDATEPAISADGRVVAFTSDAANLGGRARGADVPAAVYVRDLATSRTTLVSRATGSDGAAADRASTQPALSGDGRVVAFVSAAANLSEEVVEEPPVVYVHDRATGATRLASRASGRFGAIATAAAAQAALSADGTRVAWASRAPNLTPASGAGLQVYVRRWRSAAPDVIDPPTITPSGTVTRGTRLTCRPGRWDNDPTSFTFTWFRGHLEEPAADGPTYTTREDDDYVTITCVVTASNAAGSATAASEGVEVEPPDEGDAEETAARLRVRVRSAPTVAALGMPVRVRVHVGAPARLTLTVLRGRRVVAVVRAATVRGPASLRWSGRRTTTFGVRPVALRPGRYRLVVVARAADGRRARVEAPLRLRLRR